MRSSSISLSLDEKDSKIWKVSRCRTAVSNETIPAARNKFFFTKVAPVQTITDIELLNFWLMLLYWMFILSYATIYFFVKKLFFQMFIFQWIRYSSLYVFWLRKWQSIKYVQLGTGRGGVKPHMHVRIYNLSFYVFGNIFVWKFLVLLV